VRGLAERRLPELSLRVPNRLIGEKPGEGWSTTSDKGRGLIDKADGGGLRELIRPRKEGPELFVGTNGVDLAKEYRLLALLGTLKFGGDCGAGADDITASGCPEFE
jgi:hypothetical protein